VDQVIAEARQWSQRVLEMSGLLVEVQEQALEARSRVRLRVPSASCRTQ